MKRIIAAVMLALASLTMTAPAAADSRPLYVYGSHAACTHSAATQGGVTYVFVAHSSAHGSATHYVKRFYWSGGVLRYDYRHAVPCF